MSFFEYLISGRLGRVLFSVLAACVFVLGLAVGTQAKAQEDHSQHQMSSEDIAVLRSKSPLYQEFTDEEVMANMSSMNPSYDVYVSDASVRGDIGILALAHGFKEPGDTQFKDAMTPMSQTYPTAVGYGMAMMSSAHIQSAVDNLIAAGAKTIVLIYTSFTPTRNLVSNGITFSTETMNRHIWTWPR